jgi:hypothetical protein
VSRRLVAYYRHQNEDVIDVTARSHGFTGDRFWWKIDRKARTCTDEATGKVYRIPDGMDLT